MTSSDKSEAAPPPRPIDDARPVVEFWRDAGEKAWFAKNEAFDRDFRDRFLALHEAAARRELDHWIESAEASMALMILLDQFPRNAFRGTAHMFATDPLARKFAKMAITRGHDRATDVSMRSFYYMPLEHSEDLADQELSVRHCSLISEDQGKWARLHRDIIQRFGRFPHRNRLLARETTGKEQAFLDAGGFAG